MAWHTFTSFQSDLGIRVWAKIALLPYNSLSTLALSSKMMALRTVRTCQVAITRNALGSVVSLVVVLPTMTVTRVLVAVGIIASFDIAVARATNWVTPPACRAWLSYFVFTVFT